MNNNNANEPETVSRRSFLKMVWNFIVLAVLSTSFYSFILERYWIDTTHVKLKMTRLPGSFNNLKVIHISDLHLGFFFGTFHLKAVVKKVNSLKPDLICFTGDLIDEGAGILKEALPILKNFKARLGKVAIFGNHDYRTGHQSEVMTCLRQAGFTFLKNDAMSVGKGGEHIAIAGVDDLFGGHPDVAKALTSVPQDQFTLLLGHEPDLADGFGKYPVDLQLSGHSHGGQIRLPLYGAVYTPDGAQKYIEGLHKIPKSNMMLYVNRGLGTTYLPFRFHCRPEITVFTLKS